jgi:hypothetical protein
MRRYKTRHGHIRSKHIFLSFVAVLHINFFLYQRLADNKSGIRGLSGRAEGLVLVRLEDNGVFLL